MDIVITILAVGIAATILIVVMSSLTRFEGSKSVEFRRLEADRERRWLDCHIGWYDRHGRR